MHVQEVDTANDIGKTCYVDLIDGGAFTGALIAIRLRGSNYSGSVDAFRVNSASR
jgi:hypothetical protein